MTNGAGTTTSKKVKGAMKSWTDNMPEPFATKEAVTVLFERVKHIKTEAVRFRQKHSKPKAY